jgi:hypothetical protein
MHQNVVKQMNNGKHILRLYCKPAYGQLSAISSFSSSFPSSSSDTTTLNGFWSSAPDLSI